MSTLVPLVVIILIVAAGMLGGFFVATHGMSKKYPFNWRVVLGPWAYLRWLRRTEKQQEKDKWLCSYPPHRKDEIQAVMKVYNPENNPYPLCMDCITMLEEERQRRGLPPSVYHPLP